MDGTTDCALERAGRTLSEHYATRACPTKNFMHRVIIEWSGGRRSLLLLPQAVGDLKYGTCGDHHDRLGALDRWRSQSCCPNRVLGNDKEMERLGVSRSRAPEETQAILGRSLQ